MTYGAFHALIISLNLQHPKLTDSYNHVVITWLSIYDCWSLFITQWKGILLAGSAYLLCCYQSQPFS